MTEGEKAGANSKVSRSTEAGGCVDFSRKDGEREKRKKAEDQGSLSSC